MSKAALSDAVQARILQRVQEQVQKVLQGTPLKIEKDGRTVFNRDTGFSLRKIRNETNPNQEAVVSRGGLKVLAKSFERLQSKNVLAQSAVALLGDANLFDALKDFLLKKINNSSTAETLESESTDFIYQGVRDNNNTTTAKFGSAVNRDDSFKDVVVVNNIEHGQFNKYFIEFLRTKSSSKELVDFIEKNVDTGHLAGVFNIRLQRVFGLNIEQSDKNNYRSMAVTFDKNNDELNKLFQQIITLITDADYLSSNISFDLTLFSTTTKIVYDKTGPRVSVETQLSLDNQEIGRKLSQASKNLNTLLDAADTSAKEIDKLKGEQAMQDFLKSLKPLADEVNKLATILQTGVDVPENVKKAAEKILQDNLTIQTLLTTEGSDPIIRSIEKTLANTLKGIPIPAKNISTSKDRSTDKIKYKKTSSKTKIAVKKPKKYNVSITGTTTPVAEKSQLNLIKLLDNINQQITQRIRQNMGTGFNKDVLNYRTGRFAESVKVERLSESRAGMITAFYSYMKNPYATFSQGGRQEIPRSRDPKLLISKSIREIASTLVTNRLRAVNL